MICDSGAELRRQSHTHSLALARSCSHAVPHSTRPLTWCCTISMLSRAGWGYLVLHHLDALVHQPLEVAYGHAVVAEGAGAEAGVV